MKRHTQIPALLGRIERLEQRRAELLEGLLVPEPFLKGSLSLIHRTCGKPNCHCARQPGHPVWVLATGSGAGRRGQVVRQADLEAVRARVEDYRRFRGGLRELEAMAEEEKRLLKSLLEARHEPYK